MAAATITSGYPKILGQIGMNTVYLWRLTSLDDTDTLATGLGARIVSFMVNYTGNPGTQAAAGGHSVESAGTITFYPGTDALGADVIVIASGV